VLLRASTTIAAAARFGLASNLAKLIIRILKDDTEAATIIEFFASIPDGILSDALSRLLVSYNDVSYFDPDAPVFSDFLMDNFPALLARCPKVFTSLYRAVHAAMATNVPLVSSRLASLVERVDEFLCFGDVVIPDEILTLLSDSDILCADEGQVSVRSTILEWCAKIVNLLNAMRRKGLGAIVSTIKVDVIERWCLVLRHLLVHLPDTIYPAEEVARTVLREVLSRFDGWYDKSDAVREFGRTVIMLTFLYRESDVKKWILETVDRPGVTIAEVDSGEAIPAVLRGYYRSIRLTQLHELLGAYVATDSDDVRRYSSKCFLLGWLFDCMFDMPLGDVLVMDQESITRTRLAFVNFNHSARLQVHAMGLLHLLYTAEAARENAIEMATMVQVAEEVATSEEAAVLTLTRFLPEIAIELKRFHNESLRVEWFISSRRLYACTHQRREEGGEDRG